MLAAGLAASFRDPATVGMSGHAVGGGQYGVRRERPEPGAVPFELEPEVRDWLDGLSDSDFKRVDEVCGMLAEKAPVLAARGQITWTAPYGNCASGFTGWPPG